MHPAKSGPGYPPDEDRELRIGRSHRAFTGDFGVYQGGLDELRLFDFEVTDLEMASSVPRRLGRRNGGVSA